MIKTVKYRGFTGLEPVLPGLEPSAPKGLAPGFSPLSAKGLDP